MPWRGGARDGAHARRGLCPKVEAMASTVRTRSGAPITPHTPVCPPYPGSPPSPRPPAPTCPGRSTLRASARASTTAMAVAPAPVTHTASLLHASLKRPRPPCGRPTRRSIPAGTLRPRETVTPSSGTASTPGVPPDLPCPKGGYPDQAIEDPGRETVPKRFICAQKPIRGRLRRGCEAEDSWLWEEGMHSWLAWLPGGSGGSGGPSAHTDR